MTFISALILLINLNRTPSTQLRLSPKLEEVAQYRAEQSYADFSHEGFTKAFQKFDYEYGEAGENLAKGYLATSTIWRAILIDDAFLNSPTHRENMLDPAWRDVGIGVYKNVVAVEFGYLNP